MSSICSVCFCVLCGSVHRVIVSAKQVRRLGGPGVGQRSIGPTIFQSAFRISTAAAVHSGSCRPNSTRPAPAPPVAAVPAKVPTVLPNALAPSLRASSAERRSVPGSSSLVRSAGAAGMLLAADSTASGSLCELPRPPEGHRYPEFSLCRELR